MVNTPTAEGEDSLPAKHQNVREEGASWESVSVTGRGGSGRRAQRHTVYKATTPQRGKGIRKDNSPFRGFGDRGTEGRGKGTHIATAPHSGAGVREGRVTV